MNKIKRELHSTPWPPEVQPVAGPATTCHDTSNDHMEISPTKLGT